MNRLAIKIQNIKMRQKFSELQNSIMFIFKIKIEDLYAEDATIIKTK